MRRRNPKVLVLDGEVVGKPSEVDCVNHRAVEYINRDRFNASTNKMKLHTFIYDFLIQSLISIGSWTPSPKLLSLCGPELEGHHALWMEALKRHDKKDSTPTFIERSSAVIQENNLIGQAVKCKATLVEGSVEDYIDGSFTCLDLDYCQNFKSIAKTLFPSLKKRTLPVVFALHITGGYRGKGKNGVAGGVTSEERDAILYRLDRLIGRKMYGKGYAWEEPTKEILGGKYCAPMRCVLRSYHKDYARIARELS